ncbi:hypothetical protein NDU88_009904 [Pleurodeles waltl]|uniref:Uncharacterized protein n=1 Tax=Pleurodeles waltl TaxID=8319 RepID=A0AAV7S119_PLEWA|nr:hypothetical protein NDU88_009904 [Pleurodeles waltl]
MSKQTGDLVPIIVMRLEKALTPGMAKLPALAQKVKGLEYGQKQAPRKVPEAVTLPEEALQAELCQRAPVRRMTRQVERNAEVTYLENVSDIKSEYPHPYRCKGATPYTSQGARAGRKLTDVSRSESRMRVYVSRTKAKNRFQNARNRFQGSRAAGKQQNQKEPTEGGKKEEKEGEHHKRAWESSGTPCDPKLTRIRPPSCPCTIHPLSLVVAG